MMGRVTPYRIKKEMLSVKQLSCWCWEWCCFSWLSRYFCSWGRCDLMRDADEPQVCLRGREPRAWHCFLCLSFSLSSHKIWILFYTSIIINSLITTEPEILLNSNLVCISTVNRHTLEKSVNPIVATSTFNIKHNRLIFLCCENWVVFQLSLTLGGRVEIILCWANVKRSKTIKVAI